MRNYISGISILPWKRRTCGLKSYLFYYNAPRPNMGLKGLTPYEKIKELQGIEALNDFKVSENPPLDTNFSFNKIKGEKIRNEKVYSHPI